MELKDKLKKLRQEKNISQQKLADELHTSRSVIAKWETGIAIPQEEYINAIVKYFEIDKNELIESVNKQNIKPNKRNRKFIVLLCSLLMVCVMVFIILSMTLKPERTINKTLNELTYINEQNTTNYKKSYMDAYSQLWELLDTDVTQEFINRFQKLFKQFVRPEKTWIYVTEVDEDEEDEDDGN